MAYRPLPVALREVMDLEKEPRHGLVGRLGGIKDNFHNLHVPGLSRADLLVRRIVHMPAHIAGGYLLDAGGLLKEVS